MNAFQMLLTGLAILFGVYLVARLATAAYFKSRHYYEREKHHE